MHCCTIFWPASPFCSGRGEKKEKKSAKAQDWGLLFFFLAFGFWLLAFGFLLLAFALAIEAVSGKERRVESLRGLSTRDAPRLVSTSTYVLIYVYVIWWYRASRACSIDMSSSGMDW